MMLVKVFKKSSFFLSTEKLQSTGEWQILRCLRVMQRAQLSVTNWPWQRIWILWWMMMMEFWTTTTETTLTSALIMKRKTRRALLSESFLLIHLRFRTESPLINCKLYWTNLFQLSLIQDGIYVLGKAHNMHSTSSFISFPNIAFETILLFVWLTMALSQPFKKDRLVLPLSTPLSSMRSMVWCPWLCASR